jgi:hypothetical protein
MSKSRQSHETAKALVNPLFAWTNAVIKGGEMMLDSMKAAVESTRTVRVAVLRDADAPAQKRSARGKSKGRINRAKSRRGARRAG